MADDYSKINSTGNLIPADGYNQLTSMGDITDIRKSNGLFTRNEIEWYTKFNRFNFGTDPYDALLGSKEYIFFTKPNLHLFSGADSSTLNPEIAKIPFFIEAKRRYPDVLRQLVLNYNGNKTPFITMLSAAVQNSLDLPSITSDALETGSTVYDTKISYQNSTIQSDQAFDFSLEFQDSKYLELYELFKVYDQYEKNKELISPPDDSYILNKILYDQFAAYKIITDEDGETIIYYAKLYGVYPKGVPRDAFGNLSKDPQMITYNVEFHANFVEDYDPLILTDFNALTENYYKGYPDIPIWNAKENCVNGDWCNIPYIKYESNPSLSPTPLYKLKWR